MSVLSHLSAPFKKALFMAAITAAVSFECVPGFPASGASAQTAPARMEQADREKALTSIKGLISEHYLSQNLRSPLVEAIRRAEAARRYDTTDGDQFAARVTETLHSVVRDGHLYLRRDAARYYAMMVPSEDTKALETLQRERAIQRNHGFVEAAVRPGNIRYVKLSSFDWVADGSTARAYDRAADFLADGDALIFDLRGNGGGHSEAADYFTEHLLSIARTGVAKRRPAFILVDADTGSAAEAVAYDAKVRHAAVIVGARTYGAANNVRHYPVAPDLILSMSYQRPIHPLTGTNWEGTGVAPDVPIEPALALERAELAALQALSANSAAGSPAKARYEWRAVGLRARLEPTTVEETTLGAFAGRYGAIEIREEAGVLRLYRPDRPRWPPGALLQPMASPGLFAMEGTDDLRIQFSAGRLHILRPDAEPEAFPRKP